MYFVFVYMDWILSSHAVTSFLFASYKMIFSFYKVEVLSIGRSQRTCFSLLWGLLRFRLRKLSVWTLHFHRMLDLAGDWLFSIINDIQIWWEDEIAYVYISYLAREQSLLLKIYWYYMNSFILRRSWQSFNFNWKLWSVTFYKDCFTWTCWTPSTCPPPPWTGSSTDSPWLWVEALTWWTYLRTHCPHPPRSFPHLTCKQFFFYFVNFVKYF